MRAPLRLMILVGVILMLSGCLPKKYKVSFGRYGFRNAKTMYAQGETVEVSYMPATDTSYRFYSSDVEFEQDYDPQRGIILRFVMPDHDVTIGVDSENTMTFDPNASHMPVMGSGSITMGKGWLCPECGQENSGRFCSECGHAKPE